MELRKQKFGRIALAFSSIFLLEGKIFKLQSFLKMRRKIIEALATFIFLEEGRNCVSFFDHDHRAGALGERSTSDVCASTCH